MHVAISGFDSHEYGGGPHTHCFEGYCDYGTQGCVGQKHPSCGGIGDHVQALAQLLDNRDYAGLSMYMGSGAPLEVLWEEGVVAIYQCAGQVGATVALEAAALGAVAVAEMD
jgi:hypothetical protein